MGVTEKILSYQLDHDIYYNDPPLVAGIARLAIDNGYDTLTKKQQQVLETHLTKECFGYTDPGGHHNGCSRKLSGDELLNAYEQCDDPDSLQCESCIAEAGYDQHVWDKNFAD